jgi:hypothetical protein
MFDVVYDFEQPVPNFLYKKKPYFLFRHVIFCFRVIRWDGRIKIGYYTQADYHIQSNENFSRMHRSVSNI